jgi:5-methylcytosine-specific restriction endonuclease McrA
MSLRSANSSTRRWRQLRARKLRADPWCECGCGQLATEVDHKVELAQWPEGRYVWSNLRSLAEACHLKRHGHRPKPHIDASTGLPLNEHWWCEQQR